MWRGSFGSWLLVLIILLLVGFYFKPLTLIDAGTDKELINMLFALQDELDNIFNTYGGSCAYPGTTSLPINPNTGTPLIGDFNEELMNFLGVTDEDKLEAAYIKRWGKKALEDSKRVREIKVESLVRIFNKYREKGLFSLFKERNLTYQFHAAHIANRNNVLTISGESLPDILTGKAHIRGLKISNSIIAKATRRVNRLKSICRCAGPLVKIISGAGTAVTISEKVNELLDPRNIILDKINAAYRKCGGLPPIKLAIARLNPGRSLDINQVKNWISDLCQQQFKNLTKEDDSFTIAIDMYFEGRFGKMPKRKVKPEIKFEEVILEELEKFIFTP